MSKKTNSEVERTLRSIKGKLLSIFAIISVIGAVLFLLAQGDIIPVAIPIIFVVISILLYVYFLVEQIKIIKKQVNKSMHWYEEILDSIPFPLSVTD